MISYKIIHQNTTDIKEPQSRQHVNPKDPNYRATVFQRNLNHCRWNIKDRVKVRRGHAKGTIIDIITDFNSVVWEHNKPLIITVLFDNGVVKRCALGQLKASKT